ncbi:MAG: hypothetical protein GMKNLPBB_02943 [Myxococcota bacterium]|nr:hypothetical protein [Myxococcota bacterium]
MRQVACGLALAAGLLAAPARAAQYEVFIEIEDEQDLYELLLSQDISETTFDLLLDTLRTGVDLNTASRDEIYVLPNITYAQADAIIEFRMQTGGIKDPSELIGAGVLDAAELTAIAPFLVVSDADRKYSLFSGRFRYGLAWAPSDDEVPPMFTQFRLSGLRHLSAGGALLLNRQQAGDVRFDPSRLALSALEPAPTVVMPKLFLKWETPEWGVIGGSYRIGFAQRLTLDNTNRYTPNGFYLDDTVVFSIADLSVRCRQSTGELDVSPCAGDKRYEYITPDYDWYQSFRGVALGVKKLKLGDESFLQAFAFGSHQTRSIYQYELYSRLRCDDPQNDDDPNCGAPSVFVRRENLLEPTSRFSYSTLPDMFNEIMGGGHASFFFNRRSGIGVTGYYATTQWLSEGAELDFQEWSRFPYGGPFGAVGLSGSYGVSWLDMFIEGTRSLDSIPNQGGDFGVLQRSVASLDKHELELALRYYGKNFDNPYSRAIAAPDEVDGVRSRDEAGARFRHNGRWPEVIELRSSADFWTYPSDGVLNTNLFLRADYLGVKKFIPSLWVRYFNKNLGRNGPGECFDFFNADTIPEGEPLRCGGERYVGVARLRYSPARVFDVSVQYQHEWLSDPRYKEDMRQDAVAWLTIVVRPVDRLGIRLRGNYRNEDISDNTYLRQFIWSYLDAFYNFAGMVSGRLRYDFLVYLDERDSTAKRNPSPEHRFRFDVEARF